MITQGVNNVKRYYIIALKYHPSLYISHSIFFGPCCYDCGTGNYYLPPHHLCRIALHEALVSGLLISEGHGCVAPVIARNAQPFFNPAIAIDRSLQIPVEAAPYPQRVCHERTVIQSRRAVKGRARVPRFGMDHHHCRRIIKQTVPSLLHYLLDVFTLGNGFP
jgi:hypothetical protein